MTGRIHSVETFGTVDGPGIRYVLFLQGCPLRCQYCHNPDTWANEGGTLLTVDEILDDYEKYRPFLKEGGITTSGGEPLIQIDFLIELYTKAHERNIHTALDTSGITFKQEPAYLKKLDKLLAVTDLVLLDVKHIDPEEHLKLTKKNLAPVLGFGDYLEKKNIPVWIRHVVIPGLTFNKDYLTKLGKRLAKWKNIKALDVLPYHTMGVNKYTSLNLEYPLEGVPALSASDAALAREYVITGMKEAIIEENQKKLIATT